MGVSLLTENQKCVHVDTIPGGEGMNEYNIGVKVRKYVYIVCTLGSKKLHVDTLSDKGGIIDNRRIIVIKYFGL